jgi:hypothetical protein
MHLRHLTKGKTIPSPNPLDILSNTKKVLSLEECEIRDLEEVRENPRGSHPQHRIEEGCPTQDKTSSRRQRKKGENTPSSSPRC